MTYVDLKHLFELLGRGIMWVSRIKDNMAYNVVGQHTIPKGHILKMILSY